MVGVETLVRLEPTISSGGRPGLSPGGVAGQRLIFCDGAGIGRGRSTGSVVGWARAVVAAQYKMKMAIKQANFRIWAF